MQRYEPALIRAHAQQISKLMGAITVCSSTKVYQKRLNTVLEAILVIHDLASSALLSEMLEHGCGDECFEPLEPIGKTIKGQQASLAVRRAKKEKANNGHDNHD